MKYFTIKELTNSYTAIANNIDNTPTKEALESLTYLVDNLLDPIREDWKGPITITSGYRSIKLNEKTGGVATSQHMKGEAVDITTGNKEDNKKLFDLISNSKLKFDQLIDEKDYRWLHVSLKKSNNRQQVLHLK